jgi:hypothetical protein
MQLSKMFINLILEDHLNCFNLTYECYQVISLLPLDLWGIFFLHKIALSSEGMPISCLCLCWNYAFWTAIYFDTMTGLTSLWHSSMPWIENRNTALLIGNKNAMIHLHSIHMCSSSESSEVVKVIFRNILETFPFFTSHSVCYAALRRTLVLF